MSMSRTGKGVKLREITFYRILKFLAWVIVNGDAVYQGSTVRIGLTGRLMFSLRFL